MTIAQLPYFLTGIPLATDLLYPLSSGDFRKANTQGDSLVCWYTGGWRFSGPLGDEKLDRLDALCLLRIMPIAHTDEMIAVLRASLLGTFPARLAMQRSTHVHHLTNASVTTQGQMRAEHHGSCSPVLAARPLGL